MTIGPRVLRARALASWIAVLIGLVALVGSGAARAQVPGTMNFQGLLLNAAGQPKNGTVNLVFALYAAPTGGSALWTETLNGVAVSDGIYDVVLGASTPLTPSVFSSAERHLQITVDGEVLSPRRQLLVVPYAIRADTATTATTATTALNVGGVSADFVGQVYQYGDFDGNGLLNSHAKEGLAELDGDGLANFIDPDNDGDGLSDATEIAQGSDPNQLTATLTGFSPTSMIELTAGPVTVMGTNFDLLFNLSVTIGQQPPQTPTNVTPTSFRVHVSSQTFGMKTVTITSSNAQTVIGSFPLGRRITAFVTSTTSAGNLVLGPFTGLNAADQICKQRASAGNLPAASTYFAWISTATDSTRTVDQWPAGSVFDLVSPPGPPAPPLEFASSYNELVTSTTHTPGLANNEFGQTLGLGALAWTGGGSIPTSFHCSNWTVGGGQQGTRGYVGTPPPPPAPPGTWQNDGIPAPAPCLIPSRLYCFED